MYQFWINVQNVYVFNIQPFDSFKSTSTQSYKTSDEYEKTEIINGSSETSPHFHLHFHSKTEM